MTENQRSLRLRLIKKMRIMKHFLPISIAVAFVLASISALWLGILDGYFKIETVLIWWALWSGSTVVVVPAILSDDFTRG